MLFLRVQQRLGEPFQVAYVSLTLIRCYCVPETLDACKQLVFVCRLYNDLQKVFELQEPFLNRQSIQ